MQENIHGNLRQGCLPQILLTQIVILKITNHYDLLKRAIRSAILDETEGGSVGSGVEETTG